MKIKIDTKHKIWMDLFRKYQSGGEAVAVILWQLFGLVFFLVFNKYKKS